MTETSGPRGRISLIKSVAESRLDVRSPGFVEQMWQCLDCRACEAVCPSGVRYGQLVETARAQIEQAGRSSEPAAHQRRRRLLRFLFGHPKAIQIAATLLRFAQRCGLLGLAKFFGLSRAVALAPTVPHTFFPPQGRWDQAGSVGLAFLHRGCVMPVLFSDVHQATVRMLLRAGLSVTVPQDQGCCGAIAVHSGDIEFARELAKRNIAAFEHSGADVYVVNAAGCGSALKEYARLLAEDAAWAERAAAFSARVRDVTELLDVMDMGEPARAIESKVTYQEPCHLAHAQRITGAPRRLLQRIPGLQLVEMEESAVCCGGAGIYNLTEPDMAHRLARRKIDAICRTEASIVATANPGCAIQLEAGLRDAKHPALVKHIVELLDEAYSN